jgi:hypothetical protein
MDTPELVSEGNYTSELPCPNLITLGSAQSQTEAANSMSPSGGEEQLIDEYDLIESGLRKHRQKGVWAKVCDICGDWITLGGKSGSLHSFEQHRGKTRCIRTQKEREKRAKTALNSSSALAGPKSTQHQACILQWFTKSTNSESNPVSESISNSSIPLSPSTPDGQGVDPSPPAQSSPLADAELNMVEVIDVDTYAEPEGHNVIDLDAPRMAAGGASPSNQSTLPSVNPPCAGIRFEWPLPEFASSYPWPIHSESTPINIPYKISRFDGPCHTLPRAQHVNCKGVCEANKTECSACANIPFLAVVKTLRERALNPKAGTPYPYLGHQQVSERAKHHRKLAIQTRLVVCPFHSLKLDSDFQQDFNTSRKVTTLMTRLSDRNRLLNVMMTEDVPQIRHILLVAARNHTSMAKLVEKMGDAARGLYHPRAVSSHNINIMRLISIAGGPKLAFAVGRATGLPSLSTARRHSDIPNIVPCLSTPLHMEISANITTKSQHSPTPYVKRGHNLQIDEISLEERPRYLKSRNAVLGLCREHTPGLNVTLDEIESVQHLALKVKSGECHVAKEATVAAIAAFSSEHYSVTPLLISPTCKTEKPKSGKEWIAMIEQTWHESKDGEAKHGPIWSLASDGDPSRRMALHSLTCIDPVSQSDPLWAEIGHLRGFNRFVGKRNLTSEYDPRHEGKRAYNFTPCPHHTKLMGNRPSWSIHFITWDCRWDYSHH